MTEPTAQKITSLQRCVSRARQTHEQAGENFKSDFDLQDAAILNILRACEQAIDLANMLIRLRRMGIPTESRDSFRILQRENIITAERADKMCAMVGFRNLAVHQYQDINLAIVESLIEKDLGVLLDFAETIRAELNKK